MPTIRELELKIKQANKAYWISNKPIIDDITYDNLIQTLKELDPNNKLIYHIGGAKGKYRHNPPMLSLDKAYNKSDVINWVRNFCRPNETILVQPKYDGLAGKIEDNHLITRGDGELGEDITRVLNVVHIAKKFSQPVLGELLLTHQSFSTWCESNKLVRIDGTTYSNPRNAVAGLVNQLTTSLPKDVITFVPYQSYSIEVSIDDIDKSFDELINAIRTKFGTIYPIDGVVFRIKDEQYATSLGNTAHHPRGAIAFKFTNVFGYGELNDVVWQSGKEVLTPVAILKTPIILSSCYISRATCHNLNQFKQFALRKGDKLRIEKAGDIIPKITNIEHGKGVLFEIPTKCPICNSSTITVGTDLMCSNENCSGKLVPRMIAAAKLLRIDGFGPATCSLLHDRLKINELWELLATNYCYNIGCLPGFTSYSAEQLYRNLTAAVGNVYEYEVLAALCIPGIGPEISRKVFSKYTYNELLTHLSNLDLTSLIGPTRSDWLKTAFSDRRSSIENMFKYFIPISTVIQESKGKICLTGKFDKPKSYYKELIESNGYTYTNVLTSDVKYLVTNSLDRISSKTKKAKLNNIPIISTQQLFSILEIESE